jgi:transcriptional regulator with XRE-family HTH domain
MRKSTATTRNYRPGASRRPVAISTFRDQMADYARAERLRELRDGIHWSREKVAGEIGVTTKTLYAWENGGSIRWENAKKLAAFYKVDPESLVSRELGGVPTGLSVNGTDADELVLLRDEVAELSAKVDRLLTAFGLVDHAADLDALGDRVLAAFAHALEEVSGAEEAERAAG